MLPTFLHAVAMGPSAQHSLYLLIATAFLRHCSASTRQSSQLRITNAQNKTFCLRVNSYAKGVQEPAKAARQPGAVIDVQDCDFVDKEHDDYVNRDIVDHWVLGAKSPGQGANVRHWMSGHCLSTDPAGASVLLWYCGPETIWQLYEGRLEAGTGQHAGLCLEPDWNATKYGGGKAFPLKLVTNCTSQWQLTANPLVIYPVPDPSWLPNYPYIYNVSVCKPGGQCYQSYAYYTEPLANQPHGNQGGKNLSFTTVSFDGEALKDGISVIVQTKYAFATCVIAPRNLGIACRKVGQSAQFTIPRPMMKVSVEFDPPAPNDESRVLNVVPAAMLVFADPLDDVPDPDEPGIVYLGPGIHDISTRTFPHTSTDDGCMTIPANTEVYVAGGAYVVGAFRTLPGVNNVTIRGRGVVTIEGAKEKKGCIDGLVTLCGGLDLHVEGVATVDSQEGCVSHIGANTYFQTRNNKPCNINPPAGRGPVISNTKVIGWQFATGIMPGRGAHVSDSFIRVNDDCNPDFQSNQVWERNMLWQLDNGWPFMMQWNTDDVFEPGLGGGAQNVVYQDSTVVHVEQLDAGAYGGDRRSVFGAWQGMSNTKTNLRFKNINIEGGVWTALIMLYVGNGPFSQVPNKCCGNGNLTGISFENIAFEYHGAQTSLITGNAQAGGRIRDVNFKGVTINSQAVTEASFIPMTVDDATTSGIAFKASSGVMRVRLPAALSRTVFI